MLNILEHPLLSHYLTKLEVSDTPNKFRYTLAKIASFIAPLATSNLPITEIKLSDKECGYAYQIKTLLVAIVPTGIFLLTPLLEIIPDAKVGYLSYGKKSHRSEELEESMCFLPDSISEFKTIIVDYGIITGKTIRMALSRLILEGITDYSIISVFATPNGIENIRAEFPNVPITIAKLFSDEVLDKFTSNDFFQYNAEINKF